MNDNINLSLCMIVRDNEETIGPCLESIRPWVDEIVIVDTGSRDRTPEIVKSFGARLFHKPWEDDFAAARNASIEHARGNWIFWMDSDDTIPAICGEKLQRLARTIHRNDILGFVMQVRCPGPLNAGTEEFTVVDHVKMFRNHPALRFEGMIHEQVMMPIRKLGGEIAWTDIYVVHSGSDQSAESKLRKVERDLRILGKDLQQRPNHPFVLFNLAMTYAESYQFNEALGWIEKCLSVSRPQESHVPKAYAYLANCLFQTGRPLDALAACRQGRQLFPIDPELLFREAMICHELGQFDDSISRYQEILQLEKREVFQSTDPGIRGFKCRFNLGVVLRDSGYVDEAEFQWRSVLRERPHYRPACRAVVDLLLDNSRMVAAEVEVDRLAENPSTQIEGLLLRSKIQQLRKSIDPAEKILDQCLEMYPGDEQVLEDHSRFHLTNGNLDKAVRSLLLLVEQNPSNAGAFHNLGAVYFQLKDYDLALESLRRSIFLNPKNVETRILCETVIHVRNKAFASNGNKRVVSATSEVVSLSIPDEFPDVVSAARILSVYKAQGYPVEFSCPNRHEPIFRAAGATIVEQARRIWDFLPSPYSCHDEDISEWQVNNAGWNLSAPPLPFIEPAHELWNRYIEHTIDTGTFVGSETKTRIMDWLGELPKPIVLLHDWRKVFQGNDSALVFSAFCNSFVDRMSGSLVLLGSPEMKSVQESLRIRQFSEMNDDGSVELLLALLTASDLLIAPQSMALELSGLVEIPTIGIWQSDKHPARFSCPRKHQLNLHLANSTEVRTDRWRIPWNIVECDSTTFEPEQLFGFCESMLGQPKYLTKCTLAADVQMQYWIQSWCHQELKSETIRDRNRSFDILFQEIRTRFEQPTIVETGTIRAAEDWAGAGFFTYLAGAYVYRTGGVVFSVDIDPTNCEFARKSCVPFGKSVQICNDDSVSFLRRFEQPIDVLYIDSVDTYAPEYQQHALNEVMAAAPRLHANSMIVLDDSPTIEGEICGKGTLAVPWLLSQGWKVLFSAYQVILTRDPE